MSETEQTMEPTDAAPVDPPAIPADLIPPEYQAAPVAEADAAPEPDTVRPWHGAENPLEAMYLWVKGEIEALKGGSGAA